MLMMVKKSELQRPTNVQDYLLDRKQLAALLGVSLKTIQRWQELGRLPLSVEEMRPMLRWRLSDVQKHFGLRG